MPPTDRRIRPLRGGPEPERADWGGKACQLRQLAEAGVNVPAAVVVPAEAPPPSPAALRAALGTVGVVPDAAGRMPLAVRSAVWGEDEAAGSLAGSFRTVLATMTAVEAARAVATVRASAGGRRTGVLLQRLLDCAAAGVLLTAHPLSHARNRLALAGTSGRGDRLVGGQLDGGYAELPRTGDLPDRLDAPLAELLPRLAELREVALRIEANWATPVDLEWAVEAGSGTLWVLQARPVVLPEPVELPLDSAEAFDALPRIVTGHHKLTLRRRALRAGVPMSRAAVLVARTAADGRALRFWPSREAAALSVVLLWPERVDDAVVREFAPTRGAGVGPLLAEAGDRWTVRRPPEHPDLAATVPAVLAPGLRAAWLAVCLVQEIHDAAWTGILRRIGDGHLVELAQGHFVPKGVVVTARYQLDDALRVVSHDRPAQPTAYRFVDGHVLREEAPVRRLPDDRQLADGVRQLLPILAEVGDAAVEFGLLDEPDGVRAYLIDVAESDRTADGLDPDLIGTGVVSAGRARGRTVLLGVGAADTALDAHLHDRLDGEELLVDTVLVAERASTDLLPLVYRCGRGSGVVFGTGSVLGHVGVVLRERGVPAVVVGAAAWRDLVAAAPAGLRLDALTAGIAAPDRVAADPGR